MEKWRVYVEESRRKYVDVEAPTEDEAWEMARCADEDKYIVDHDYDRWEMERPYRIYEDNKEFHYGDRIKLTPNPALKKQLWNAKGTISLFRDNDNTCRIDFDKQSLKVYNCAYIPNSWIVHEDVE